MTPTLGQAFLIQAQEDLCAAEILGKNIMAAPSTFCMLLQMVFEKLAKADKFWKEKKLPQKNSHVGSSAFFAKYFDAFCRCKKLKKYSSLQKNIKNLESFHPAIAKKNGENSPQLEYPWGNDGKFFTPAQDLSLVQSLKDHNKIIEMHHLLKFAREFSNTFRKE